MKLTVVIPALNQFPLLEQTLKFLESDNYDILVIDNGSDEEFKTSQKNVRVLRLDENVGNYPVFKLAFEHTDADIIAVFHSDFFVYDTEWSQKVIREFERDPKLGLIGFIGSNEIDYAGGRGLGTASNFQGQVVYEYRNFDGTPVAEEKKWIVSPAEAHGKRLTGFMYAAVVDGCSMIFRRDALRDIGFRDDFPPHHFYDRLFSTQMLEKGWRVGVLGIACDHVSGQTANQENKWQMTAKTWATEHHISPGGLGVNWDNVIYAEAERRWLSEYRNNKHIVPCKVDINGNRT